VATIKVPELLERLRAEEGYSAASALLSLKTRAISSLPYPLLGLRERRYSWMLTNGSDGKAVETQCFTLS